MPNSQFAIRNSQSRIIVAVTGASGTIYAKRLLETLPKDIEIHLLISENGEKVGIYELGKNWLPVRDLIKHANDNFFSPVASGSFKTLGMVIVPCSMGTLAAIAQGLSLNLIHRSADVCIKEKRKLIIVPRETPYSSIHLQNMLTLAQAGASIVDANPPFYQKPKSIDDMVDAIVGRILDQLGIDHQLYPEWTQA